MTTETLVATLAAIDTALSAALDADWGAPVDGLDWTVREVAAHLADSYFAQAAQVIAQPTGSFLPAEVRVDPGATPADLVELIGTCGRMLLCAAATAHPTTRAWHPWGTADTEGWLAMGVVEGLVHTADIARGLGLRWYPPSVLCAPVLTRLFPHAPEGDEAAVLLWCTGRAALPHHPQQPSWRWFSQVNEPD